MSNNEMKITEVILFILSVSEIAVSCTVPSGSNISVVPAESESREDGL